MPIISSEDQPLHWTLPFFLMALCGFVTSLAVHLSTFLGFYPSMGRFWLLHLGIFLVWVPTLIVMRKKVRTGDSPRTFNMDDFPKWLRVLCVLSFIYAFLNFFLSSPFMREGRPEIKDGNYVLLSHGAILRNLTEAEYLKYKSLVTRGFSGHWIMFYTWAAATLGTASFKKNK